MAEANPDLVVRCNGRVQNVFFIPPTLPPSRNQEKLRFIWSSIVHGNNSSNNDSGDDDNNNNNKCKCKYKCEAIKLNLKFVLGISFLVICSDITLIC
jgi:hypothetical protein